MGSEWSIWNGALGEEWKSWPSPCPLPCPPQIWNGTLGEEWKPDLQVTQQAPSLALFTILSLRNNLSKQQFIHLIDWFVIAQILTKKKKYETIEGIWAVKPFFYKFKHLFSFKILYRRLWGQIHKISLDTIVEIHLLLFPLLRLLCKYWLILYYCIATRQDRQGPRLTLGSGLGNLTNCSKLDIWSARLAVSTMGGLGQCGDLKWAMSGI